MVSSSELECCALTSIAHTNENKTLTKSAALRYGAIRVNVVVRLFESKKGSVSIIVTIECISMFKLLIPAGDRTRNLPLRRRTRYPFRHRDNIYTLTFP